MSGSSDSSCDGDRGFCHNMKLYFFVTEFSSPYLNNMFIYCDCVPWLLQSLIVCMGSLIQVSVEQRVVDEREEALRAAEEKLRHKDAEAERRLQELRQAETAATELTDKYNRLLQDVEARERASIEHVRGCSSL